MDNQSKFTTRLNRVITEIKNFKTNQLIGGDSWIVYRSEIDYSILPSHEYLVTFAPESSNDFTAVCKVTSPDRTIPGSIGDLTPDPYVNGKWWRRYQFSSTTPVIQTFFVYSTVKGTVSVQDVTGMYP